MAATILMVDDDPATRRLVCALLKQEGYRTLEAGNGTEALELLRKETPDLILLDIIMPGVDGFEVCKAIREDPRMTNVPVIMLSVVSDQVRDSMIEADDYMTKPFAPQDLISKVEALMAQRSSSRDRKAPQESS